MKKVLIFVILLFGFLFVSISFAWKQVDYKCFNDCFYEAGYSYDYCKRLCSYEDSFKLPDINEDINRRTDYKCFNDCYYKAGYSYDYCKESCSY